MIVEDDHDTRAAIARLLGTTGYFVLDADCCKQAIRLANLTQFDVLLVDVGLPDGDGLGLLASIRQRYPIHGIVLSGYGEERDIARGLEAGFDEYLVKPIGVIHILEAIKRVAAQAIEGRSTAPRISTLEPAIGWPYCG